MKILKRFFLFGSFLIGIATILLILFFISEDRVPEESELSRYPDFVPFIVGRTSFRGGHHDLDFGSYSFYFKTSFPNPENFFNKVEGEAEKNGWKKIGIKKDCREFIRKSRNYPSAKHLEKVTLQYNPDTQEYFFQIEPQYKQKN